MDRDQKPAAVFNATMRKFRTAKMSRWRAHSAVHVSKVSQIMAPDRSSHHKMTDPGQNGLSSTFSGKFPIKMLIQTVGGEKKRGVGRRKNTIWRSRSRQCFPSLNRIPSSVLGERCNSSQFEVDRTADGLQR